MKIIVGLGNIGTKYSKNRHNTGFIFLDHFAKKFKDHEWKEESKFKAIIAKIGDILLVKPTTLMNLSGEAVIGILNFYKIKPTDLIVIYDDIDLPLGKIRVREKGSAGTHNGLKSVIQSIGTEEFARIRIGIESRGTTSPEAQDISSFVLSDFKSEELILLNKAISEGEKELQKMIG